MDGTSVDGTRADDNSMTQSQPRSAGHVATAGGAALSSPRCSSLHRRASLSALLLLSLLLLVALCPLCLGQMSTLPAHCPFSSQSIKVGVFYCSSPNTVICSVPRIDLLLSIWQDHVNNVRCGLLGGSHIAVELVLHDMTGTAANASELLTITNRMVAQNVDFVILPPGSNWYTGMLVLESLHIPAVAPLSPNSFLYQCTQAAMDSGLQPSCARANTRRFQYAHSISSPGEKYFREWIGLLQLKGASTLIVVSTPLALYQTIIGGLAVAADDAHIQILAVLGVGVIPGSNSVADEVVSSTVRQLEAARADAVMILASDCIPWVRALHAINYLPKSLATLLCTDSLAASTELGESLNFIVGPSQWDPHLSGTDYQESNDTTPWGMFFDESDSISTGDFSAHVTTAPATLSSQLLTTDLSTTSSSAVMADEVVLRDFTSTPLTSTEKFVRAYQTVFNLSHDVLPSYTQASILGAAVMLEGAIESAGSIAHEDVNRALQLFFAPSFFGLLTTDRYGMNQQKQTPLLQRDRETTLHIIAPSAFSSMDFIYPMPNFDERLYVHRMFDIPIEQVLLGLVGLCCTFTMGLCAYMFHHRKNQIFQAGGVWFYMLMGFGCLQAYLSILAWPVENNAVSCAVRIWSWTLAFQTFVAPMVACALRIARIYTEGLVSVRVSNRQVAFYCVLIATPQVILDILWASIAPLRLQVVELDPLRPKYNYTVCTSSLGGNVFASLTLIYSGILLGAACFLAWKVRKAYAIFNDAKPIVGRPLKQQRSSSGRARTSQHCQEAEHMNARPLLIPFLLCVFFVCVLSVQALSMYIFTISSVVVLVVQLSLNSPEISSQKVLFALRSAGVLIAYQSSLAILFLRRIFDQLDQGNPGKDVLGTGPQTLQTAIASEFGHHSPHLKTEISDVVWRNDQKQKVNAMLRADALDKHAQANAADAALMRAQWVEQVASPNGLFSRGDSSAPPTPVMRPFGPGGSSMHRPHPHTGGTSTATGTGTPLQAPTHHHLHGDGTGLEPNYSPFITAFSPGHTTHTTPAQANSPATLGLHDPAPASSGAGHSSMALAMSHANAMPGQTFTKSALGDPPTSSVGPPPGSSPLMTSASSGLMMGGTLQHSPALFATSGSSAAASAAASSASLTSGWSSAGPTPRPMTMQPISLHALSPETMLSVGVGGIGADSMAQVPTPSPPADSDQLVDASVPIFPLPSVAALQSLHPSHFFAWREQVRQHIALLQIQHALEGKEPAPNAVSGTVAAREASGSSAALSGLAPPSLRSMSSDGGLGSGLGVSSDLRDEERSTTALTLAHMHLHSPDLRSRSGMRSPSLNELPSPMSPTPDTDEQAEAAAASGAGAGAVAAGGSSASSASSYQRHRNASLPSSHWPTAHAAPGSAGGAHTSDSSPTSSGASSQQQQQLLLPPPARDRSAAVRIRLASRTSSGAPSPQHAQTHATAGDGLPGSAAVSGDRLSTGSSDGGVSGAGLPLLSSSSSSASTSPSSHPRSLLLGQATTASNAAAAPTATTPLTLGLLPQRPLAHSAMHARHSSASYASSRGGDNAAVESGTPTTTTPAAAVDAAAASSPASP